MPAPKPYTPITPLGSPSFPVGDNPFTMRSSWADFSAEPPKTFAQPTPLQYDPGAEQAYETERRVMGGGLDRKRMMNWATNLLDQATQAQEMPGAEMQMPGVPGSPKFESYGQWADRRYPDMAGRWVSKGLADSIFRQYQTETAAKNQFFRSELAKYQAEVGAARYRAGGGRGAGGRGGGVTSQINQATAALKLLKQLKEYYAPPDLEGGEDPFKGNMEDLLAQRLAAEKDLMPERVVDFTGKRAEALREPPKLDTFDKLFLDAWKKRNPDATPEEITRAGVNFIRAKAFAKAKGELEGRKDPEKLFINEIGGAFRALMSSGIYDEKELKGILEHPNMFGLNAIANYRSLVAARGEKAITKAPPLVNAKKIRAIITPVFFGAKTRQQAEQDLREAVRMELIDEGEFSKAIDLMTFTPAGLSVSGSPAAAGPGTPAPSATATATQSTVTPQEPNRNRPGFFDRSQQGVRKAADMMGVGLPDSPVSGPGVAPNPFVKISRPRPLDPIERIRLRFAQGTLTSQQAVKEFIVLQKAGVLTEQELQVELQRIIKADRTVRADLARQGREALSSPLLGASRGPASAERQKQLLRSAMGD